MKKRTFWTTLAILTMAALLAAFCFTACASEDSNPLDNILATIIPNTNNTPSGTTGANPTLGADTVPGTESDNNNQEATNSPETTTPACEHSNVAFINCVEPTCTSDGYTGDICCMTCSYVIVQGSVVEATGHQTALKNDVVPTCTQEGYSGDIICMVCNEIIEKGTVLTPAGHVVTTVNVSMATCSEDGYTGDEVCTKCNETVKTGTVIKAEGHRYGNWVTSKEPTGFETGSKYRTCTTCKAKETASIPKTELYPIIDEGEGYKITITREWYKKAWVYVAHLKFTDYARFGTSCANGKYKNGYETTSHAASRLGAILTINGCYSAPKLDYTVVRSGKIWNGANRNMCLPGVYSSHTGLFQSGWEGKQGTPGISGVSVQQLVDEGKVTDTFCFGPPGLVNGELIGKNEGARAQRTFMGTNGNAGDIWLCVSDGRYNDGESAGLTFYEAMEFLTTKGCTFGLHLDGGGSSTMVYRGHVLNAVKEERAVVDFVYFK